jgi:RNA polymerase sigma factor (sigma-70 family)
MGAQTRSYDAGLGTARQPSPFLQRATPARETLRSEHECSDAELVAKSRKGETAAYGELVRRHERAIHRHLFNLTGSREEARELAQDVFLKAWGALGHSDPGGYVQAWLYRIASNLAFDLLRRRKVVRFEPIEDNSDAPSAEEGPEERLQSKQAISTLQAALDTLPADLKDIILLREVEGLSYDEISAALDINEGTVKSRLARARAALAKRYEGLHP